LRDVVFDFQGAGADGGDTVRLLRGEFAWVGQINATPSIGAVLPGGGDGNTQLGYIQSAGNTFLVADTDDDGLLDGSDDLIEFRGLHSFTPEDFDNTDFIIAGTNGNDVIEGTEGTIGSSPRAATTKSSPSAAMMRCMAALAMTSSTAAPASTPCSVTRAMTP
jgi:hypothetical protein